MGQFRTNLIAEKQGINWALHEPLVFDSAILGLIIVPAGYATDFASVPRMPFAYWLAGDTAHASAVIHDSLVDDGLYGDHPVSWKIAADVFMEAMSAEGIPAWRRHLMYWAVRLAEVGR